MPARSPARAGGAIEVAPVATADGGDVVVRATNADHRDGPVLAGEPPFTPEELLDAAPSDVWLTTS